MFYDQIWSRVAHTLALISTACLYADVDVEQLVALARFYSVVDLRFKCEDHIYRLSLTMVTQK